MPPYTIKVRRARIFGAFPSRDPTSANLIRTQRFIIRLQQHANERCRVHQFQKQVSSSSGNLILLIQIFPSFVNRMRVLKWLLLRVQDLPTIARHNVFSFLTPFHLISCFRNIIRITFRNVRRIKILFGFPIPMICRFGTFIKRANERSRFRRFSTQDRLRSRPFLFRNVFQEARTIFRRRTFANRPLLIPHNTRSLPRNFLGMIIVVLRIPLTQRVSHVTIHLMVKRSTTIQARKRRVIPRFRRRIIRTSVRSPFVNFKMTALRNAAIFLRCHVMDLLVRMKRYHLISIRGYTSLPIVCTLMLFLRLLIRFRVDIPTSSILQVITISMLIPIMRRRQGTLLILTCQYTTYLNVTMGNRRINLTPIPIQVRNRRRTIRQTSNGAFQVGFQGTLTHDIRPISPNVQHFIRDHKRRLCLALLNVLFCLQFFFRVPVFFQLRSC